MAEYEILSAAANHQFPERLFDIMPDDHFWLRARFRVFLQEIQKLGINVSDRKLGLDIGCAQGVVQRQLAAHSAWSADGCDLTIPGLDQNSGHSGRVFYYDIIDRRLELRERYDFLMIFDVLEHIADTKAFLEAAVFHLKRGGFVFVNVPAMQSLHSKFDQVLGHTSLTASRRCRPRCSVRPILGTHDDPDRLFASLVGKPGYRPRQNIEPRVQATGPLDGSFILRAPFA
jgi:hypothetical protein